MNTTKTEIQEKILNPKSGMAMLIVALMGLALGVALLVVASYLPQEELVMNHENDTMMFFYEDHPLTMPLIWLSLLVVFPLSCLVFFGLRAVSPNEALVLTLFGNYYGTINKPGYFFVNPFCSNYNPTKESITATTTSSVLSIAGASTASKEANNNKDRTSGKKISMKAITLNNRTQKVNDLEGNPIEIGAMVIWKVTSPAQAVFAVDNYLEFISMQADSTLRNVASRYAYDHGEIPDENQLTLRGNSEEIALELQNSLEEKVKMAGLEVVEVKITHLAYASEIAAAMLQRQQASAILAARRLIVDGAVGMVQQALAKLDEENIVELDDERKATMISNLLVVLCANKEAQPVVNSGSIY